MKCIGQDNYITKSPFNKKGNLNKKINLDCKDDSIANDILAEINNVKSPSILKSPNHNKIKSAFSGPLSPSNIDSYKQMQHNIKIIDEKPMPLQAEFDWYNLDAEYGKPNNISQPDVVKEIHNLGELYQYDNLNGICDEDDDPENPKIEYNLDFEYNPNATTTSTPEIVEIEKNNNFTTVIKINNGDSLKEIDETSNIQNNNDNCNNSEQSPVKNGDDNSAINHFIELTETPKLDQHYHHKKRLNYEKFLSESGLSTKPIILPRKTNHRMFYAGPFV
jgi:hypothetical protein